MKGMRPAAALAMLVTVLLAGCSAAEQSAPDVDLYALFRDRLASGTAPGFSLTAIDGEVVTNEMLRGRPYVLKGFVPFCLPCMQEVEELNGLYAQYGDRIEIVSVDLSLADTPEDVVRFKDSSGGGDWHWAVATGGMMKDYGFMLAGTTFVVDGEGVITYRDPGHQPPGKTAEEIEKALQGASV